MSDQTEGYAVFLYDQALEVLGEAVKPYLRQGAAGPYIACREVDTGGAFVEMVVAADAEGAVEIELMIPLQMVRMIVSSHSDTTFGFAARHLEPGLTALPVVGPAAPTPHAPSTAMPDSATAAGVPAGDDRRQPPEG